MKQILVYFKTLLHEDMVNNFGHFKMFLSIHVHVALSLSEVAKKIFKLPGQQASNQNKKPIEQLIFNNKDLPL